MKEWISVKDRLPNFRDDTILVVVETEGRRFTDTDGCEKDGSFTYWGEMDIANVTNWMKLPGPPEK